MLPRKLCKEMLENITALPDITALPESSGIFLVQIVL